MYTSLWFLNRGKRGGFSKGTLAIMLAVVALVGFGARYLYKDNTQTEEEGTVEVEVVLPPPVVYHVGNFLVNVKTAGELRYLRADIAVSMRFYKEEEAVGGHGGHGGGDENLPTLGVEDDALVRDAIVKIFSDTAFETLRTSSGRQSVKEQIKEVLGEVLHDAQVEDVLFLSFVMQ